MSINENSKLQIAVIDKSTNKVYTSVPELVKNSCTGCAFNKEPANYAECQATDHIPAIDSYYCLSDHIIWMEHTNG